MNPFIIFGVLGNYAQQIIKLPTHQMAFENFGYALHGILKLLKRLFSLRDERDFDEEFIGQAQCLAIKTGRIASDQAVLFQ